MRSDGIVGAVGYAVILVAFYPVGTFGLFGQEQDPLAGIFLVPLGLPWNLWLEPVSDSLKLWIGVLAPALNILILATLCRLARGGHGR